MSATQTRVWACSVCGYIHYGLMPPDECPICGAERDLFEPYGEQVPAEAPVEARQWRCLNCSYRHDGVQPPVHCPVCAASGDRFEPAALEEPAAQQRGGGYRAVVAGAGIAGVSAAEAMRTSAPQAEIVLLSKEPCLPYYRLNLTRYLAGELGRDHLVLHEENWYVERDIQLNLGAEMHGLDLQRRQLTLHDGRELAFDRLVLADGSHAFVPPLPGVDRKHVTVLRTIADADEILEVAQPGMRCVCIGGGILGLETAGALVRRGMEVTIVEGYRWLLPRQLNQQAGEILEAFVRSAGIRLHKGFQTQEILGNDHVRGVQLADGPVLPADMVIITTGVRPNTSQARQAGLEVNSGIAVDSLLRTSHPDVWAAGDVTEHRGVTYGLWGPAQFQGTIAGMNAAGGQVEFAGIPRSNILKVLDYDLFSIGEIRGDDASFRAISGEPDGHYACFVFRDSHLIGAILLGDTSASAAVKRVVEKRVDCSAVLRTNPDPGDVLAFLKGASQ